MIPLDVAPPISSSGLSSFVSGNPAVPIILLIIIAAAVVTIKIIRKKKALKTGTNQEDKNQ